MEKSGVDDWVGVLYGAPAVFSVVAGLVVFGFRCLGWLATATSKPTTVQTVWGWPAAPGEVATGLRGLDQIVWWFLTDAPLELWLIVIFPSIGLLLAICLLLSKKGFAAVSALRSRKPQCDCRTVTSRKLRA